MQKAGSKIETEIIVIDNNSTDGSRVFFEEKFPGVTFIWLDENIGFAKANNKALQVASGNYVLFLNPDTILPEDCLEKCISFLQSKNDEGAMGVKMIDGSGHFLKESKRGFPSPFASFCKITGLTKLFPHSKLFAAYYLGHLNEDAIHEVDVLAGAFMLVPKKILDTTGSFDERFFMYAEDIDLSYRIQIAGFKNYYFPDTTIIHFKGESTSKESIKYVRVFYKAMILFVQKHYGGSKSFLFNLVIHIAIWAKALLSGIGRVFKSVVPRNKKPALIPGAIIVTDENSFKIFSDQLQKSSTSIIIKGRIDATDLGILPATLEKFAAAHLIFCEGTTSFKEIIQYVQLHHHPGYLFHASGSKSIIGSDDKNSSGITISLD